MDNGSPYIFDGSTLNKKFVKSQEHIYELHLPFCQKNVYILNEEPFD